MAFLLPAPPHSPNPLGLASTSRPWAGVLPRLTPTAPYSAHLASISSNRHLSVNQREGMCAIHGCAEAHVCACTWE